MQSPKLMNFLQNHSSPRVENDPNDGIYLDSIIEGRVKVSDPRKFNRLVARLGGKGYTPEFRFTLPSYPSIVDRISLDHVQTKDSIFKAYSAVVNEYGVSDAYILEALSLDLKSSGDFFLVRPSTHKPLDENNQRTCILLNNSIEKIEGVEKDDLETVMDFLRSQELMGDEISSSTLPKTKYTNVGIKTKSVHYESKFSLEEFKKTLQTFDLMPGGVFIINYGHVNGHLSLVLRCMVEGFRKVFVFKSIKGNNLYLIGASFELIDHSLELWERNYFETSYVLDSVSMEVAEWLKSRALSSFNSPSEPKKADLVEILDEVEVRYQNKYIAPIPQKQVDLSLERADNRTVEVMKVLPTGWKPRNYLDVGAGNTQISKAIAEKLGLDLSRVLTTDLYEDKDRPSPPNNWAPSGVKVSSVPGKLDYIQVKNGHRLKTHPLVKYDLITAIMLLHHVKDLDLMLEDLVDKLSPGGFFVIREHDVDSRDPRNKKINNAIYNYHLKWPDFSKGDYMKLFSKEWLVQKMTSLGLVVYKHPLGDYSKDFQRRYFISFMKPKSEYVTASTSTGTPLTITKKFFEGEFSNHKKQSPKTPYEEFVDRFMNYFTKNYDVIFENGTKETIQGWKPKSREWYPKV